ncbi:MULTISPECIES: thiamine pyrophosphate-binding protein [Archaeoglobus]|uniref:Acetolactate synthase, large subunit (IlvB-3) n=2 Tax=Archaeoglobus fulgidus TaxID=2234 RepID=O28264_ARCFU|nr:MULTISPECIES: thiamine pyrophosphate-binding protein [Archaeoglobus]AAB89235.1 acetolactate synthase, large subunit (ilvB-3) [Archaeoglobus fulgidus DSM 4304]AIG99005.1 Thiamine pyrophosphate-requiring enzyme [Archaeoglobus fulgidus DSM 8774]MDI3497548.1 acetolactate synthase large subunit [Archaeoglobus sp.]
MDGAEAVAKALLREKIDCAFSLPSGEILPVCEYLEAEGVRVIFTRHEQAAGNAADGYARVTRRPGFCIVPTGPGLANLMPALAQAYYASSPVVAIAGHSRYVNLDREAFEEIDGYLWVKEYTKWSRLVPFTHRLHEYVQEAFRRALSGRYGPVLLEIPKDVLNADIDGKVELAEPRNYRYTGRVGCEEEYIYRALEMLLNAEKPLIVAGSGVYWSRAENFMIAFAEKLSIPVSVSGLGGCCISPDHPLFAGQASASPAVMQSDFVLVVGTRFDEFLGFGQKFKGKVVHVDIDACELAKNRYVDIAISCDAGYFFSKALAMLEGEKKFENWARPIMEGVNRMFEEAAKGEDKPMKPQRLMRELNEVLSRDDIVILDGGETTAWGLLYLKKGKVISSQGPFGHLGAGIPMGIAAKAAYPEKRVFVVTGDGSFLFNGAEIDTAVRHGLQVVVVVVNDSAWGLVNHTRLLSTKSAERASYGVMLNPAARYDRFAESLEAYGELVEKSGEVKEAVKRAFDSALPAVLDVRVKLDEISPLAYLLSGSEG